MSWTLFWDMHSGGTKIPPYNTIYIEAPESEARVIFYNRFGRNPERVTCTCCGEDYSVSEEPTLREASAFHRNCRTVKQKRNPKTKLWHPLPKGVPYYLEEGEDPPDGYEVDERLAHRPYQTVDEYVQNKDVLVIRAHEIKDGERRGEVPEQGYVWVE